MAHRIVHPTVLLRTCLVTQVSTTLASERKLTHLSPLPPPHPRLRHHQAPNSLKGMATHTRYVSRPPATGPNHTGVSPARPPPDLFQNPSTDRLELLVRARLERMLVLWPREVSAVWTGASPYEPPCSLTAPADMATVPDSGFMQS